MLRESCNVPVLLPATGAHLHYASMPDSIRAKRAVAQPQRLDTTIYLRKNVNKKPEKKLSKVITALVISSVEP